MQAAVVDDVQCKFTPTRRVDDVGCMLGPQATDVLDATWREDMDPETLPMPVHVLQNEFDESSLHQFSDGSRNMFSLDANAFSQAALCLLDGIEAPPCGVDVPQMEHHTVQHRERLRRISHDVDSSPFHRNLPPFRL
jgi:hypothetical protein